MSQMTRTPIGSLTLKLQVDDVEFSLVSFAMLVLLSCAELVLSGKRSSLSDSNAPMITMPAPRNCITGSLRHCKHANTGTRTSGIIIYRHRTMHTNRDTQLESTCVFINVPKQVGFSMEKPCKDCLGTRNAANPSHVANACVMHGHYTQTLRRRSPSSKEEDAMTSHETRDDCYPGKTWTDAQQWSYLQKHDGRE